MRGALVFFLFSMSRVFFVDAFAQTESVGNVYAIYQNYISDIRPTKCPMHPSCSNYAISAFKSHGVFKALALTSDRLLRCGHEHSYYPGVMMNGEFKLLDSVVSGYEMEEFLVKPERLFSVKDTVPDVSLMLLGQLIDEGYFQEAIYEYHRILISGDFNSRRLLEVNHYRALFGLAEYEKVIFHHANYLPGELKGDPFLNIKVAEAWFKLGQFEKAVDVISAWPDGEFQKADEFSGLAHAYADDYKAALRSYGNITADYAYADYVRYNTQIINELADLSFLRPAVAGLLGVFPGGGYLYSGHTVTGFSAAILTGLLGYAAYTSFDVGNNGVGVLSGIFALTFYSGSISGGVKAAKRKNEFKKNNLKSKMKYSFN